MWRPAGAQDKPRCTAGGKQDTSDREAGGNPGSLLPTKVFKPLMWLPLALERRCKPPRQPQDKRPPQFPWWPTSLAVPGHRAATQKAHPCPATRPPGGPQARRSAQRRGWGASWGQHCRGRGRPGPGPQQQQRCRPSPSFLHRAPLPRPVSRPGPSSARINRSGNQPRRDPR